MENVSVSEEEPTGSEGSNGTDRARQGVRVWRGTEVESMHEVHAALVEASGREVARCGVPDMRAYLRSAAKPVQVLPVIEEGVMERYGFSDEEIAVMAASHNAEPFHVAAVERILEKAGLDAGLLRCGAHPPLHEPSAEALRRAGHEPTALHNNCSGKHAGMLAVCRAMGWPLETYRDPDHPLQVRIWRLVAELAALPAEEVGRATDGCGVPAFALPVRAMATLYARLAAADQVRDTDRSRALGIVFDPMAAHPNHVAGAGRLCTAVMTRAGERVVVKTGAEGVYCAAIRGARQGLALKVADGARRAQNVALLALLKELDLVDGVGDPDLEPHRAPELTNRSGMIVGHIDARLTFERRV